METGFLRPEPLLYDGNVAENFRRFKQEYELYILAAGLSTKPKKMRTAMLLNLAGRETIKRYSTFTYTTQEDKDDPATIMDKLEAICVPLKNLPYERHVFFTRAQRQGESMDSYVSDLKTIAAKCEFGDITDDLICSRIVAGILNNDHRRILLREQKLTLDKCIRMCKISELTEERARDIVALNSKAEAADSDINAICERGRRQKNAKQEDDSDISAIYEKRRQKNAKQDGDNSRGTVRNTHKSTSIPENRVCYYCGGVHLWGRMRCPANGRECHKCGRMNHFGKVCKNRSSENEKKEAHDLEMIENDTRKLYFDTVDMLNTDETCKQSKEWLTTVQINGHDIQMKLDTGAKCNVLPYEQFCKIRRCEKIYNVGGTRLISYSGHELKTTGKIILKCKVKDFFNDILFFIVQGASQPILGLSTCEGLNLIKRVLNIHTLNTKETRLTRDDILDKYRDVFDTTEVGCLAGEYHIKLNNSVEPIIHPPRRVPEPKREMLRKELERMINLGVIEKVLKPTQWVNSCLAVYKSDKIRVCIDPKDLNRAIQREHYPMPTIEDISKRIHGAKYFSVFDASCGFWQIALDEESSQLTTFNTPFGRHKYLRLPFGICSAPEIFQRKMDEILHGLDGCEGVVDDILIWGTTEMEHDKRVEQLLQKARMVGLKLKERKLQFKVNKVSYLGHILTEKGLEPDLEKIKAISHMPTPKSKQDLQRFLGMITYIGKFVPNLSSLTEPLRVLLKNETNWTWDSQQALTYQKAKEACTKHPILRFYNVMEPVTITCDASQKGLGAAILQNDQPVAYTSRALTDTQTRYAQIEKELLAVLFACERFHDYIFGKKILVETDHKPLEAVIRKPLCEAPVRLQRMLLRLQKYDITLKYKKGSELYLADTLSRGFLQETDETLDEELDIHEILPVSEDRMKELKKHTENDPVSKSIKEAVVNGWPKHVKNADPKLRPYYDFKEQISVDMGILIKGDQIIIPASMRPYMLEQIHQGHMGITACKSRARDSLYWPGMSTDIERRVKTCNTCGVYTNHQQKEPMIPHTVPSQPWTKIACDLFQVKGKAYLIMADYYSQWFEINGLDQTTASAVIYKMKGQIARYGLPQEIVTDGGPQFRNHEFKTFSQEYDFKHTMTSPRYPQSNGLIEKCVQTAKKLLIKAKHSGQDPYMALLNYRNTPMDPKLGSPAQRLMSRRTRTLLPTKNTLLTPQVINGVKERLEHKRSIQKHYYDRQSKQLPVLKEGDVVRMENDKGFSGQAVVKKATEQPRSYIVEAGNRLYRRNRKHILRCSEPEGERDVQFTWPSGEIIIENTLDHQMEDRVEDQVAMSKTHSTRSGRRSRIREDPDFDYYK